MISPSRELMAFKLTLGDFKQSYNARPPFRGSFPAAQLSSCIVVQVFNLMGLKTRGHFPFRGWVACFMISFLQPASKGLSLVWLRPFPL